MRTFLLVMLACASAHAQLVRQQNTTINLPAELPGYQRENALGGLSFSAPICLATPSGETNRLFVVERGGTISVVNNLDTTPTKSTFLTLSALPGVSTFTLDGECGLLSMAFHPNYATNRQFYIFYSIKLNEGGTDKYFQRVARCRTSSGNPNAADTTFMEPLITALDPASNHNGGDIAFGADGYLYIAMGDGGGGGDQFDNSRFINKNFWGHMHRIDVDNKVASLTPNGLTQSSTNFPQAVHSGRYKIPADNPFIGFTSWHNQTIAANTVRTEIYATGLRNPYRFSFDPPTGRLFLGDVGQNSYEEVDLITKGGDYGWSWREGLHPYPNPPSPTTPPGTGFNPINPIFEYDRPTYGWCITGGAVYRGSTLTELSGAYIFADYGTGDIVAIRENAGAWTSERLMNDNNIVEWGVDPRNNDMLYCDIVNGQVFRMIRSGANVGLPPATLSATGIFSDLNALTPNPGVVPYDPNVAFWSDYAVKTRWFSIKNLTDKVTFSPDGNWAFPAGMVWVKHFHLDLTRGNPTTRKKLETRVIVKTASDIYGLSYKWRADQTDADLVIYNGLTEAIAGSSPAQTWRFPSRTECKTCHTPVAGSALSFNTRQMNRTRVYSGSTQNQISALSDAGYFTAPVFGVNNLPSFAASTDTTKSVEHRVRSYLAVNCVQCHQSGGVAPATWDARPTTPTDNAGLINGMLSDNLGDPANRVVVPADTNHSMLLKRLTGVGVPRMPPLATFETDTTAINLLTEWINTTLPARRNLSQWQTFHFGNPAAPEAALTADPDGDGENNRMEFLTGTSPTSSNTHWLFQPTINGNSIDVSFNHPANRSCLIEVSNDLTSWSIWDVTGNAPYYPASNTVRTINAPLDAGKKFYRARIGEQ